jgi:ABC-type phosphate/phosphonate transport system substrate-binding protein
MADLDEFAKAAEAVAEKVAEDVVSAVTSSQRYAPVIIALADKVLNDLESLSGTSPTQAMPQVS